MNFFDSHYFEAVLAAVGAVAIAFSDAPKKGLSKTFQFIAVVLGAAAKTYGKQEEEPPLKVK